MPAGSGGGVYGAYLSHDRKLELSSLLLEAKRASQRAEPRGGRTLSKPKPARGVVAKHAPDRRGLSINQRRTTFAGWRAAADLIIPTTSASVISSGVSVTFTA